MSARQLTPGRIRRALDVLLALPAEALADVAERIVDQLDQAGPDPDREAEADACDGCDDFGTVSRRLNRLVRQVEGDRGAGSLEDAEGGEDDEPSICPDWQPAVRHPRYLVAACSKGTAA